MQRQAAAGEEVLFVSGDVRAFGKHNTLHDELAQEAYAAGRTLRYFGSIDALLRRFASERRSERSHESLVADDVVRNAVVEDLTGPITFFDFTLRLPLLDSNTARVGDPIQIDSGDVEQDTALELDDSTWLGARIIWSGTRRFVAIPTSTGETFGWTWEWRMSTTVLAELDRDGHIVSAEVTSMGHVAVMRILPPSG